MAKLNKVKDNDIEKVINEIEAEEAPKLNCEVEVAEDGYVHDLPLLAGYTDENGVLHKTFTYREMNGKDEEAINKADVRSNGAKMINVLVERCVVKIGTITKKEAGPQWGTIIRSMLGGDLDYMGLKIRELSLGKEIEYQHKCPNCGTKLTTVVNTDEFEIIPYKGQNVVEFSLMRGYRDAKGQIHKEGTLRLLNGFDREVVTPLFKKNVSTAMSCMISRLVSFNDGAFVSQALISEMSLRDRNILEKIIKDNTFGVDNNIDVVCANCGADLSSEIGQSNFL